MINSIARPHIKRENNDHDDYRDARIEALERELTKANRENKRLINLIEVEI